MPKTPVRIAIDTNLWVSHIRNQFRSHLNSVLEQDEMDLITSPELTRELFTVLQRPKFSDKIGSQSLLLFRELYEQSTLSVEIISTVDDCRDPKDNHLLALALDADLDFLLTGDNDLLVLDPYGKTRILKIADYLAGKF